MGVFEPILGFILLGLFIAFVYKLIWFLSRWASGKSALKNVSTIYPSEKDVPDGAFLVRYGQSPSSKTVIINSIEELRQLQQNRIVQPHHIIYDKEVNRSFYVRRYLPLCSKEWFGTNEILEMFRAENKLDEENSIIRQREAYSEYYPPIDKFENYDIQTTRPTVLDYVKNHVGKNKLNSNGLTAEMTKGRKAPLILAVGDGSGELRALLQLLLETSDEKEEFSKTLQFLDEVDMMYKLLLGKGEKLRYVELLKLYTKVINFELVRFFDECLNLFCNDPCNELCSILSAPRILKRMILWGDAGNPSPMPMGLLPIEYGIKRIFAKLGIACNENILEMYDSVCKEIELEKFEVSLSQEEPASIKNELIGEYQHLNDREFETFVKSVFERLGYHVVQTPLSGDQGADLVMSKDGEKVVVQIKKYNAPVSNSAVQEVVASKKHYGAIHAIVVTNNTFTRSAIELALSNKVDLWDGKKLDEEIKSINSSTLDCSKKLLEKLMVEDLENQVVIEWANDLNNIFGLVSHAVAHVAIKGTPENYNRENIVANQYLESLSTKAESRLAEWDRKEMNEIIKKTFQYIFNLTKKGNPLWTEDKIIENCYNAGKNGGIAWEASMYVSFCHGQQTSQQQDFLNRLSIKLNLDKNFIEKTNNTVIKWYQDMEADTGWAN